MRLRTKLLLLLLRRKIRRRNKQKHRLFFRKRLELGEMKLFQEMHDNDRKSFIKSFRVNPDQFDYILSLISERIAKDSTGTCDGICDWPVSCGVA